MTKSEGSSESKKFNTHPADKPTENQVAVSREAHDEQRYARIGVGCFTFFIGGVSGSMVGVLLAVAATYGTRCRPLDGLPACDWHIFAGRGALIGAISLPILVLWRLRRRDRGGN